MRPASGADATRKLRSLGTAILVAAGIAAIASLVFDANVGRVLGSIVSAAPWLPVIAMIEISIIAVDALSLRVLHGDAARRVPRATWLRSAMVAYVASSLLPGGRAAGEVARTASLARYLGVPRGAVGASLLQGTFLLANAAIAVACYVTVAAMSTPRSTLAVLIAAIGVWNGLLGLAFLGAPRLAMSAWWASLLQAGSRNRCIAGAARLLRAVHPTHHEDDELKHVVRDGSAIPVIPFALGIVGRLLQVVQCGVILVGVGAAFEWPAALIAEGVQLVAGSLADAIPGQVGALEGAYRLFATQLGFADSAAQAVGFALVLRVNRLIVAVACGVCGLIARPRDAVEPDQRSHSVAKASAALLVLLLLPTAEASAQTRGFVRERVGFIINPVGVEHMIAAGLRTAIGDQNNLLWNGSHIEAGAINYTSPVYSMTGGYLEVSPLSFWIVRAEWTGGAMWPIGLEGAGYFPVGGYHEDLRAGSLLAANGREALGWSLQLSTTLQGALSLGPGALARWRPIVVCQLGAEYDVLGSADYYFSPRNAVVLRRADWVLGANGLALIEYTVDRGVLLRFGVYDDLRYVPGSGNLMNQVGPILALGLEGLNPAIPEVLFVARAGAYTNHATQAGEWAGLGAAIVRYDLGEVR